MVPRVNGAGENFRGRDMQALRRELRARMELRPVEQWSAHLLAALVAVFDVEFAGDGRDDALQPGVGGRPNLRIIR